MRGAAADRRRRGCARRCDAFSRAAGMGPKPTRANLHGAGRAAKFYFPPARGLCSSTSPTRILLARAGADPCAGGLRMTFGESDLGHCPTRAKDFDFNSRTRRRVGGKQTPFDVRWTLAATMWQWRQFDVATIF